MHRFLIIFFALVVSLNVSAQIVSNADTILPVEYERTEGSDSIYVVFGPSPTGFSDTLEMTANYPYAGSGLIQWYKIRRNADETAIEKELIIEASDTTELTLKTTEQAGYPGYQVKFTGTTKDTTITRWAYFNNLIVEPYYEESCDELFIQGINGGISYLYFHPDSLENNYAIANGLNWEWEDYYLDEQTQQWTLLDSLDFGTVEPNPYFSTPPIDYENYLFKVTVTDSLGHTKADSVVYEAIAVDADFDASRDIEGFSPDTLQFEAPVKLGFVNNSINAELYEWTFYNDSNRVEDGADRILRTSTFYEPLDSINYKYPGYYDVKLKAEGRVFIQNNEERTCVDSIRKRLYITIYNSFIGELPNVITPNNDGKNDIFYFKNIESWDYEELDAPTDMTSTSIQNFEVFIYNRYGLRVYHFSGSEWTEQDAWDGKYNGSYVGAGVYYYVIKAKGYDGRTFEKKGFFHVFSSKTAGN
ncbi:hypothetical protein L21SP5_01120 [Salinivirga cyanobacteriivorans]|uniref:PKD domain-containing protein n=1 Tax=Salinivirga cyanobacteriivorans TaxID=1307839 RepID=A0A0S2HXN4_9BACT|nr:gliding motility-associated C-terminal domain-containing protein [Salinivirga cyanobacteriivorans]ALO14779.1 hypothetical protein L21SP5_01120 [Salinivirga cyanobacteriivorans]